MRFLLINVPVREDAVPNAFPTGLGSVAQVLSDGGHEVEVLDINATRPTPNQVAGHLARAKADAFAISGLVSTFRYQEWLIKVLKEHHPSVPIILGGGGATAVPHLFMEHTAADILVLGEGEHTIREVAAALSNGARKTRDISLGEVAGIVFRREGEVVKTPPRALEPNLDVFPMPAYHLFPTEVYVENETWGFSPSLNVVSSRGCPMDCHFCYSVFGRKSYRSRGAGAIVSEVQLLKERYGVKTICFVDDNLTINKKHLSAVCKALKDLGIQWGCHGRVDTADDERLAIMADSGCVWLGFGIESGSQRILDSMNKRVRVEQASAAVRRTVAHGIFANTTFIHGYPGEDRESIADSLRFKIANNLLANSFFATPYPGTRLYEETRAAGRIPDELEFVRSLNNAYDFTINLTDLSDDELVGLRDQAADELCLVLRFRNVAITPEEEAEIIDVAERFLAQSTLLPESKGIVLLRLAKHFEARGELQLGLKTRAMARQLGVAEAAVPAR